MGKGTLCPCRKESVMTFNRNTLITVMLLASEGLNAKDVKVNFMPDTTTVLRNPLSGWVMYLGRQWTDCFWSEQGYDSMPICNGDSTVRVSDYATTCYIRTSWSSLEPEEGKYAWADPGSRFMRLVGSCLQRGMRLAFRIVVDSRDQGQNTPLYVRDAGALGFADPNNPNHWSPYPDDSVFQEKYAAFVRAFGREFDNPDKVDFIDAFGLGKWGEAHGLRYHDYGNKEKVFDWITDLYSGVFAKVPLFINYHRLVGDTVSWAAPNPDSRRLLEGAISKGYSLRHDAFGMTGYYQGWEESFAREWAFRRPVIMEGGWITGGQHRYWIDPSGAYRRGHSEDVRRGEFASSRDAHANMMDFRVGDETRSWFNSAFDLVKAFVAHGGYRLYPCRAELPDRARRGSAVTVRHWWRNIGWGYCPTNIPQWNQKYKACVALMAADGTIVRKAVASDSDLSTWIAGRDACYATDVSTAGLPKGVYTWLLGLVDTTKGCEPGLDVAVAPWLKAGRWVAAGKIAVK